MPSRPEPCVDLRGQAREALDLGQPVLGADTAIVDDGFRQRNDRLGAPRLVNLACR